MEFAIEHLSIGNYFSKDPISIGLVCYITFLATIVAKFCRTYMEGEKDLFRFWKNYWCSIAFAILIVMAESLPLFAIGWVGSGLCLANLIGLRREWGQSVRASTMARNYLLIGSSLVVISVGWIALKMGCLTFSELFSKSVTHAFESKIALAALVVAALIQCATPPFSKWLLSSMTAPTPVSAIMHAGLVNAGAILLIRFSPLFGELADFRIAIGIMGLLAVVAGSLWQLTASDVKRSLACSTIAQMGFLFIQFSIGLIGGMLVHLMLHGFYKAHRFLSSANIIRELEGPKQAVHLSPLWIAFFGLSGSILGWINAIKPEILSLLIISIAGAKAVYEFGATDQKARIIKTGAFGVFIALAGFAIHMAEGFLHIEIAPTSPYLSSLVIGLLASGTAFSVGGWQRLPDRLYVLALNGANPSIGILSTQRKDKNHE